MNTKWLPIVIALVVALVAGVAALKIVGSRNAPPPSATNQPAVQQKTIVQEVETERVYVARKPIAVGAVIDASMIDTQPWPRHLLLDQFIVGAAEGGKLEGMVARSAFQSREPFIADKLANPNDPSLVSASIADGMRLLTIAVDAVSGLSGFVIPGDRVDILLTRQVEDPNSQSNAGAGNFRQNNQEIVTQTLATNIRVLAVDQSLGSNADGQISIPSTVSLEVHPEEAHRIVLGEEAGRLLLLLRGFNEDQAAEEALIARESGLLTSSSSKKRGNPDVLVIRGVAATQ